MTKRFLLLSFFIFTSYFLFSQEQKLVPTVAKPVYFDVSPPLKELSKQNIREDNSWKDGVVRNRFGDIKKPVSMQRDAILQDFMGPMTPDTTIINVVGLTAGNSVPPDTYGEAGPDHYFQVVNCSYAIYNKSGDQVFGPFANSTIWTGMPNNSNSGDAVVLYDEAADRWIFTQFSLPGGLYFQMIAVSCTPDPMGAWYRWQYQFTSMPDYPKFGVWHDAYYMSSNNFLGGWVGNGAHAYDRNAMLAGDPEATRISFELSPGPDGFITLYPADCDGTLPAAGTPNYFGYIKTGSPQSFGIYEFHADFANPSLSTFGNKLALPVTSFDAYIDGIPQLGTSARLETLSDRLMYRLQYRKFNGYDAMVVNHSVNTGTGNSGVRWYEFRKTTGPWYIYQESTYAPDEHYRWMGSIAMDTAGSIALGYSVSSSTMYPAIRYTGRHKNDPLNQMTIAERSIVEGGGCQTGVWSGRSRWGDYSGMSVDPSAPTTFWFTTEYYSNTSSSSWKTRIGSFTFDNNFSGFGSSSPSLLCNIDSTQLNVVAYGGTGNYTYSWTSDPPGFTSSERNPKVLTDETTDYIVAISDGADVITDSVMVTVIYPPEVFAGNDTIVCEWLKTIDLHGYASNYKFTNWYSTGNGTFSDRSDLNTSYTFGSVDYQRDSVDIVLYASAITPCMGHEIHVMSIGITPCTGIEDLAVTEPDLTIQPNPATDKVKIVVNGSFAESRLTITAMDGKTVYSEVLKASIKKSEKTIDLTSFSKGVYTVQVISGSKKASAQLVVE